MASFQGNNTVKILDEGIVVTQIATSIDFAGAGVTGTNVGSAVTETIPGGLASMSKEVPTGALDGNNTVFTVLNVPKFVVLNGAIESDGGDDYTLSGGGLTITFTFAPTGKLLSFY